MKKVRFAVSLTYHEGQHALLDLIENINYFLEDPVIVLFVTKGFATPDVSRYKNVIVNPNKMTVPFGNLAHAQNSNVRLLLKKKIPFTHVITEASNDLFIRKGLEKHVQGKDALISPISTKRHLDKKNKKDSGKVKFLQIMKDIGAKKAYVGQPDGAIYSKELFKEFIRVSEKYYTEKELENSSMSEIILYPTIAMREKEKNTSLKFGLCVCYRILKRPLTVKDVDDVLKKRKLTIETGVKYDPDHIYSIKRVPRVYYEPVRNYVRKIRGGAKQISKQEQMQFWFQDHSFGIMRQHFKRSLLNLYRRNRDTLLGKLMQKTWYLIRRNNRTFR